MYNACTIMYTHIRSQASDWNCCVKRLIPYSLHLTKMFTRYAYILINSFNQTLNKILKMTIFSLFIKDMHTYGKIARKKNPKSHVSNRL